jgi:hypothetical protein
MTKVFVVIEIFNEREFSNASTSVGAIFNSEEKAKEFVKNNIYRADDMEIEEMEVK